MQNTVPYTQVFPVDLKGFGKTKLFILFILCFVTQYLILS